MNKARRNHLAQIKGEISELKDRLEGHMSDEEGYRDNMPENFQGSERYEKADGACDALQEAISQLEESIDSLDAAMD